MNIKSVKVKGQKNENEEVNQKESMVTKCFITKVVRSKISNVFIVHNNFFIRIQLTSHEWKKT